MTRLRRDFARKQTASAACGQSALQPGVPPRWAGDPAPRRAPPPGGHLPRHHHRRPSGLRPFLRLLSVRDVEQLRRLVRTEVPELDGDVDHVLKPLLACGAVIDARSLHVRQPRLEVALHDDVGSRPLALAVSHVLTDLGIRSLDPPDPELLLVVSCGEPARAVFDQARRHGIAHMPVVLDEDRIRIGPLVIPGLTPCLTCCDQHVKQATMPHAQNRSSYPIHPLTSPWNPFHAGPASSSSRTDKSLMGCARRCQRIWRVVVPVEPVPRRRRAPRRGAPGLRRS